MKVTVFTKPGCHQCDATKRMLDRLEIPYELIDISLNHHEAQRLRELGALQMPRVEVDYGSSHDSWSGFRPSQIERLQEKYEIGA
jgi:glutaredoxin-like protein NrdH